MNKKILTIIIVAVLAVAVLGEIGFLVWKQFGQPVVNIPVNNLPIDNNQPPVVVGAPQMLRFSSADEMKTFVQAASQTTYYGGGFSSGREMMKATDSVTSPAMMPDEAFGLGETSGSAGMGSPDRSSTTNVQVVGMDEPDIVKNNDKNIYFSNYFYGIRPMMEPVIATDESLKMMPPIWNSNGYTKVISAWPADKIKALSDINLYGQLLLEKNTLVVLADREITAYDVTDPSKPKEAWHYTYGDNQFYNSARLNNGKLYLLSNNYVNVSQPCPFEPFGNETTKVSIACTDIYHPTFTAAGLNSTYVLAQLDAVTGKVDKTLSFVGSSDNSLVYVSPENFYFTYYYPGDKIKFILGAFEANMDIIPAEIVNKVRKLNSYEISDQSKITELGIIIDQAMANMSDDARLKLENEMENRIMTYAEGQLRNFDNTTIVKIALKDLTVTTSGSVPGQLLNQFSLDEYQGNLRVATTLGQSLDISQTVSDVNVLDAGLKIVGTVKDLGAGERIYSARFIQDKGYVVTFKQMDPFYVLDLSNPAAPVKKGELKIPGYSSYLHPLAKNIILGVGEENNKVKLSLFDVSDPSNPTEIAKYSLNEYWTAVSNNHHAFLQDEKFKVFFIPGGEGGYIFSYADNKLSLTQATKDYGVQRALFIDDYFYVVSTKGINVYSEKDWKKVSSLEFK